MAGSKHGPVNEQDKARENRARRAARRQGRALVKIQRRDPGAPDWNRWLLFDGPGTAERDHSTDRLVITGELMTSHVVRGIETGASLDEVETALGIKRDGGEGE